MRTVLWFLLLAALAIAGGWWVAGLSGTVSATIGDTALETSLPVALTLLAALLLAIFLVLKLLSWLIRTPRRVGFWKRERKRDRGDTAVTRTLLALASGDSAAARRAVERSRRLLGDTPLTLLLSAQTARQAGRDDEAAAIYHQLAGRGDAAFLGWRGLLRQAMDRQDWEEAAAIARHAEGAMPGAAWLREERAQLALRTGNWRDAIRLSGPDAPKSAYATAASLTESDPGEASRLAKQAWEADPGLTPAALAYAESLRAVGKQRAVGDVLRRSWAAQPHPDLAKLALTDLVSTARLQAAKALTAGAPDSVETHLLLGRTTLGNDMLAEARGHAEAARAAAPDQRRTWLLLADVAEADGDRDASREALRRAAEAGPDPAWQCAACGTVHEEWRAICSACGTPGRIRWTVPAMQSATLITDGRDVQGSVQPPVEGGGVQRQGGDVVQQGKVARLPHVKDVEHTP